MTPVVCENPRCTSGADGSPKRGTLSDEQVQQFIRHDRLCGACWRQRLLKQAEARGAADEGIGRADDHADTAWRLDAVEAWHWCCRQYHEFTADEFWRRMEDAYTSTTHNPSALGGIVRAAVKQGWCKDTGRLRMTEFRRRHRELKVWASTICVN